MKKILIILTVLNLLSFNISAQEQTDKGLVEKHSYYFDIVNNKPSGIGFDLIEESIKNSQFIFLGEEHFSARVSEFTKAIVPSLAKNKFKHFAAEIGPNSAEELTKVIKQDNSLFNFNSYTYKLVGEIPVPFFDGKEDEVFLKSFIANGFELCGLDQEYLSSHIFLFDELYELSKNKEQIKSWYESAKDFAVNESKRDRADNKYKIFTSFLSSKEISDFFDKLDKTDHKTQKIISDLKKSWEVYKLREDNDYFLSFKKRLKIMQYNFIDYYNKALQEENLPKFFIKIGGVHASKARNQDNICDIGNFVMELANFNKQKSTHILIFPSAYINKDGTISSNIEKEEECLFNTVLEKSNDKWVVIDLKNIEKASWRYKIKSEILKKYMYSYDYMILTPATKQTEFNCE